MDDRIKEKTKWDVRLTVKERNQGPSSEALHHCH